MGLHRALQKEGAPMAVLDFIVENEQKLQSILFQEVTAFIVHIPKQDLENNAYRNKLACTKFKPSVPLETQIRDFERKFELKEMRQNENSLLAYRNNVLNLIRQHVGGAYYRDTLLGFSMQPNWRDYSSEQMRDVFRVDIDKAEEYRRGNGSRPQQVPGGLRLRSHWRTDANTRAPTRATNIESASSLSTV
ncbi:hypothetical protein SARC_04629 [Sphaeroforma arctica JP610]|uniref:Uncharacterized protein n=1 Tax=Sphaeroforma arctica JP610 TaxID=667725 RepID=A0A0L0G215_9EUKA|nr:hypothetical protein SARC_04629 [Sphaeroforma arctica JP610]KNC83110.1 hypothetical protein SARC_04629 [Sphaeroforma arctica JP610]|eukprot:XP_014157012.1 hypothetical protein SARC_04629 [Sphaeroforma arctica JP610]